MDLVALTNGRMKMINSTKHTTNCPGKGRAWVKLKPQVWPGQMQELSRIANRNADRN